MSMAVIKLWECDWIVALALTLTLTHARNRVVERRARRSRSTIVTTYDCANLAWLDEAS
jgi:hypothetical protein